MPAGLQHAEISLASLVSGVLLPASLKNTRVTGLQLDSRKVKPGDVFLAVPGQRSDGRVHIDQALEAGASAVLAEAEGLLAHHPRLIPVAGLKEQLSAIAGRFYGNPSASLSLLGITGTNGKTTCSHLLGQLLSRLGRKTAVIGTLGFGVFEQGCVELQGTGMTTPDPLAVQQLLAQSVSGGAVAVSMEVSSHSLDQGRVAALRFDTAVFTNLSRDHLDYHADMESYARAKTRLFLQQGLRNAVINVDDPAGLRICEQLPSDVSAWRYGLQDGAAIRAHRIQLGHAGISADIQSPWGEGHFYSRLLGTFNIQNLLAVISVAVLQGFPLQQVLEHVPELHPVPGRMEQIAAPLGQAPAVLVDYAHTPDALRQALQTLRQHCQGQLWVVFGCGGDRDKGKRPEMGSIASELADNVIITSDNPRTETPLDIMLDIATGVTGARMIEDRAEAIRTAIMEADQQDMVLIAGKGHESWQEIGAQKLPFDDREVGASVLREIHGGEA